MGKDVEGEYCARRMTDEVYCTKVSMMRNKEVGLRVPKGDIRTYHGRFEGDGAKGEQFLGRLRSSEIGVQTLSHRILVYKGS